jgi:uncharacterized membrane protein
VKGLSTQEITMLARAVAGGGILFSALYIVREIRNRVSSNSEDSQTLDELWERYERGEISWDEYEALSRKLKE